MADTNPETPGPKPRSRKKFIWIILCVASMVAGAVTPLALGAHKLLGLGQSAKKTAVNREPATIPFGDVAVNLSDGRMTRYLRVKVVIIVDESDSKDFTKHLDKHKPVLKNWLIGYLSEQSMHDVTRQIGVNRLRREIRDEFNAILYPDGEEKILDVLFDEFVVQ